MTPISRTGPLDNISKISRAKNKDQQCLPSGWRGLNQRCGFNGRKLRPNQLPHVYPVLGSVGGAALQWNYLLNSGSKYHRGWGWVILRLSFFLCGSRNYCIIYSLRSGDGEYQGNGARQTKMSGVLAKKEVFFILSSSLLFSIAPCGNGKHATSVAFAHFIEERLSKQQASEQHLFSACFSRFCEVSSFFVEGFI